MHLILRVCNPLEPLDSGDERWFDFAPFRRAVVLERMQKVFTGQAPGRGFHHRVLTGHRGCGKSTELNRFKKWADGNGFCAIRVEVDVRLGYINLEVPDFFLLAAAAAEEAARQSGVALPAGAVKPIVEWFAEVTREDKSERSSELAAEAELQLGNKIPLIGGIIAKFTSGVKSGTSHAVTVRQQMRNYPDRLIELTNALLEQANHALGDARPPRRGGLILIYDNLERFEAGMIDRLLLSGSSLLQRLAAHALYTIPIDLEYTPRSGPIRDAYGQPIVLPMIPVRKASSRWKNTVAASTYDKDAVGGMREALERRLVISDLFERAADVDRLVRMSGGCIRDLMHLVCLSYEMSRGDRLTHEGVETAIKEMRATYQRSLEQRDYARLAAIASRQEVPRDDGTLRLLFNRWGLEYYDNNGEIWTDAHPLVIEIDEFQTAYRQSVAGHAR